MSFGGLILTNSGRNKIAGALSENNALNFTHVKLGDGTYNGSFSSITKLTSEVMELPITNVTQKDNEVIIDCDWNSNDAPKGFYLREIGIIGNGVLCYYDNTGSADAEYIDPESKVVAKQKRLRFTLIISSEVNVTTKISSGLYALSETVTQEMKELDDKKLNKDDISDWAKQPEKPAYTKEEIGLGNVPNVATNDQTPTFTEATTLAKLTSDEKLSVAFGKISKAITDLIVHIKDSVKHITDTERTLWNTVTDKVDKVTGKGLSSNDYTTTEKNKLAGIASGANAYSLPLMTSSVRGGAKIGYSTNGKNYPVQLNGSGQMFVNVPWLDTNTWRGIQDNLTSTSTTDSLSAYQGKILNDRITWKDLHMYGTPSSKSLSVQALFQANAIHEGLICVYEGVSGNNYCYCVPIHPSMFGITSLRIIDGYSTPNGNYTGRLEISLNISVITLNAFIVGNVDYSSNCHLMLYYR